jgi:hypothetical protein
VSAETARKLKAKIEIAGTKAELERGGEGNHSGALRLR